MYSKTDFLVIGSGVAGLIFAIKASQFGSVAIVTKRNIMDSNTAQAQGGIASVFNELDSFDLHIKDTLNAGDGLCRKDVVEHIVKKGPEQIKLLMELGVNFSLAQKGENKTSDNLALGREGGHSHNRIVHAFDMTGKEIQTVLVEHVLNNKNIKVYENNISIDLITLSTRVKRGYVTAYHEDYCCGAYVLDVNTGKVNTFLSQATLLSTGGTGKVYLYTSNPDIATGDGVAMGYRAGATVANLEFVQFHPTCLYHPAAKNFLISEAVRGEGGILITKQGNPFMEKYSPLKDLACRDVVARAIDLELKKSGDDFVYLDISQKDKEFVKSRFPNIYQKCLSFGMDITHEPIPVVPAAHYMCGGVVTDVFGRTAIKRLYAVGETACTGLHGANRLASNSLLEALVCSDNACNQALKDIKEEADKKILEDIPPWDDVGTTHSDEAIVVSHNWDEIRRCMWNYVGIVRSNKRLERAQRRIENIQKEINEYYWDFKITSDLVELRNISTVAELIIKCAMHRKESRGLHYNIEYPNRDDEKWNKDTVLRRHFLT
ncbi:MAG: L-aspartate oxidase [Desulfobacterales bacterium]|nr:L-aspartate oxidase [Desulfobacterales bacterium]